MSFFSSLPQAPEDPIFSLNADFAQDTRKNKVNLGIGVYRDANLSLPLMRCVAEAEKLLAEEKQAKGYLPIIGMPAFIEEGLKLVYGEKVMTQERIVGFQSIGGTGALRVIGDFFKFAGIKEIYLSNPTWANHKPIFEEAGLKVSSYPYYNENTHKLEFEQLCDCLKQLPSSVAVLFHASCHNPTGKDLSQNQWEIISDILLQKQIISVFDSAYQGLGRGIEKDVWPIRYFAEQGHEMFVATSFSKNMGLYNERIGLLSALFLKKESVSIVKGQIQRLIRRNYSNPSAHGAKIVCKVLKDPHLREVWLKELNGMSERLQQMRHSFTSQLQAECPSKDFSFLLDQRGMFSFCGLTADEVHRLRRENGIYMPSSGRVNIAGLNQENLNNVIQAILSVVV